MFAYDFAVLRRLHTGLSCRAMDLSSGLQAHVGQSKSEQLFTDMSMSWNGWLLLFGEGPGALRGMSEPMSGVSVYVL